MQRGRTGLRLVLSDRSVVAVSGIAFVLMLGNGIVLPVLPLYARSFDVGYGAAGLLVASYGIVRIGVDLVAGAAVERFGERRAGAAGLAGMALFALLTGLSPVFGLAVAGWAGVGAVSAVAQTASYTYLLRVVPQERMARTVGIYYGSFNVGLAAGGFASGAIAETLGVASPLYVAAGLYLLSAVLYLRYVPALDAWQGSGPSERVLRRAGRILRLPGLRAALAAQLAWLWVFAAVFGTLIALFGREELGISPTGIGVVFAVGLAVELLVLYPAGMAADRRGRKAVLVPALAGVAVFTAVLGLAGAPVVLGLLVGGLALVSGLAGVAPSAMVSDVVAKGDVSTAAALFRLSGDVGFALGPLVAGFVASGAGFAEAFAVSAIPAVLALTLVLRTPETLRVRPVSAADVP